MRIRSSQKLWIELIPLDDEEDACGLMVIAGEKAMLQRKLIGSNAHVILWTKSEHHCSLKVVDNC